MLIKQGKFYIDSHNRIIKVLSINKTEDSPGNYCAIVWVLGKSSTNRLYMSTECVKNRFKPVPSGSKWELLYGY